MEFCQKCGGIMKVENNKANCASCGSRTNKKLKIESSEKIQKKEDVPVIKEDTENANPVVDMPCPKCSSKKAYFWTLQTRAADESETKFYKCVECKHTWRKYR